MEPIDVGDYLLPPDLTGELARIHRLVSEGYVWWKAQEAPFDALPRALAKLHMKHRVLLDAEARRARRKADLPVAQVVAASEPEENGSWPLMLMATKKLKGEEMHHVKKRPPSWSRYGVTFQLAKDDRGKWQWWIHPDLFTYYREALAYDLSRRNWEGVRSLLFQLDRLPDLRGINLQRLDLLRRAEKAWGDFYYRTTGPRRRKPDWMRELKERWRVPLSIRRVKTQGPTLGETLAKLTAGK